MAASNVIDLNARRPRPAAAHPNADAMRTQLDWLTRVLADRVGELVRDLNAAAASGEATDPAGAIRVANRLDHAFDGVRAKLEALPPHCIPFPLARTFAGRSRR